MQWATIFNNREYDQRDVNGQVCDGKSENYGRKEFGLCEQYGYYCRTYIIQCFGIFLGRGHVPVTSLVFYSCAWPRAHRTSRIGSLLVESYIGLLIVL
jgi:hypothetical protein